MNQTKKRNHLKAIARLLEAMAGELEEEQPVATRFMYHIHAHHVWGVSSPIVLRRWADTCRELVTEEE